MFLSKDNKYSKEKQKHRKVANWIFQHVSFTISLHTFLGNISFRFCFRFPFHCLCFWLANQSTVFICGVRNIGVQCVGKTFFFHGFTS